MRGADAATDRQDDLVLIREAARQAGEIAMRYFRKDPEVWFKPGQSPVTEADYAVDSFLREALAAARPDYGWLSEETADSPERLSKRRTFIVDPIDGTRAFIEGRDVWCVSIAVVEAGRPIAGVLDCPVKGEVFEAASGRGATMNGSSLSVSPRRRAPVLAGPKPILSDFEWRDGFRVHEYVPSLAYRIAMLADGRIDGTFVKSRSHDWDLAAADLILEEAGGRVLDRQGRVLAYAGPDPERGVLAAGSGPLLDAMVAAIAGIGD